MLECRTSFSRASHEMDSQVFERKQKTWKEKERTDLFAARLRAEMRDTDHGELSDGLGGQQKTDSQSVREEQKSFLPRLLSLFFIVAVDGHAEDIVGEETGKWAWNEGTFASAGSKKISSSDDGAAMGSGVTDEEKFVELFKCKDVLTLSISSNCSATRTKRNVRQVKSLLIDW